MMQEHCQFFHLPPPNSYFLSGAGSCLAYFEFGEDQKVPGLGPFPRNSCLLPFFSHIPPQYSSPRLCIVEAGVENQPLNSFG